MIRIAETRDRTELYLSRGISEEMTPADQRRHETHSRKKRSEHDETAREPADTIPTLRNRKARIEEHHIGQP